MPEKDYQYFKAAELQCHCTHPGCPKHGMDDHFMKTLIALRERLSFPFVISSAYRCPEHNNAVSTTGLGGPHTLGMAVDVRVNGIDARTLVNAAVRNFEGIGIQQQGPRARRFIHLDTMKRDSGQVIWSY